MKTLGVLVLICLLCGRGEGFFSKFSNRKKGESNRIDDDFVDVCKTVRIMPRIAMAVVGGAPLKAENSAPYIAAIGERLSNGSVSWFCGGSLISPYAILTAAHCLISRNVSTVRLGSFSTKKRSTENDYEVLDTIIHPGYKITESYNDVAIIKVKDRVTLDSNIKPVCLPQDDSEKYEKERAKVIGWGAEEFGGEGTHKLQQVEVEVFSNSNCDKAYRNSTIAPKTFPRGIEKGQLCAGSSKGGKDACQGDSGGPLVLTDGDGIVRQIGIVSTGAGCGFKMYPGVYARVSSYIDWIQQQIKASGSTQSPPNGGHSSKDSKDKENPSRGTSSNGQSSEYKNGERTTRRPNNSPNSKGYSSKEVQNSKESSMKNNPHSDKGKYFSEYKDVHGLSTTHYTSTRPTPHNEYLPNHHGNQTPGPNYSSSRETHGGRRPGSDFSPAKQNHPSAPHNNPREENRLPHRANGINGLSSREQTSSRVSQPDQLSSIQRPSSYLSP